MFRNYIVLAVRHFRRNHITSIINVLGLTLGLATCLIAGLYIKHDLRADKFHANAESIFRVTVQMEKFQMYGTPYPFAQEVAKDVRAVRNTLRTFEEETTVKINDEIFKKEVLYADPSIFQMFTFPLTEGNEQKALSGLKSVVISSEMRERYYPRTSALGKQIEIKIGQKFEVFEITGVLEQTPAYSSMYFNFLIPLDNKYIANPQEKDQWDRFFLTTFLQISPSDTASFYNAIPAFVAKYFPPGSKGPSQYSTKFELNSYADHYLGNNFGSGGMRNGKSKESLIVFGGIAIIILLLACFNFMNLANARASKRAVEVGVKKVVGAARFQLVRQFLVEALVMSALAALLGLALAELGLFLFRDLLQVNISFFHGNQLDIYIGLVVVTFITGVLSGFYPAFVLSSINMLQTFRRQVKIGGNNWFTRAILSAQFALSIILIVCAMVMWKQQEFVTGTDLGFNREQVVALNIPQTHFAMMDALKTEIAQLPNVESVTKTTINFNGQSSIMHHAGKDGQSSFVYLVSADEDFIPTMEMEIVEGKNFDAALGNNNGILVNESLAKELGITDSVGVRLGQTVAGTKQPVVTGIVKDFHHAAMKYKIGPMMIVYNQLLGDGYLLVRLAGQQTKSGLEELRRVWEKTVTDSPFEFSFVDENVQKQYEAEQRWSIIITLATGMAIFLSILGLLGLAMFTAEQRKKEIGIRKVMGASVRQLVALLSRDYVILMVGAFAVSIPASYYIMNTYWLNNFEYKTSIDVLVYAAAFVVVLAILIVSVGSQTTRAALQNPSETLKEQ